MAIGPAIGHMHHVRIRHVRTCHFTQGGVFVLRIAMDVSDVASSEVEPVSFAVGETLLEKSLLCVWGKEVYNSKGSGKRPHQRYTELVNSRLL